MSVTQLTGRWQPAVHISGVCRCPGKDECEWHSCSCRQHSDTRWQGWALDMEELTIAVTAGHARAALKPTAACACLHAQCVAGPAPGGTSHSFTQSK